MPKLNVLVAGSTGYIGIQLIKLLSKHKNISQKKISKAWRQRWLESRIQKPEIQEKLYSANPNNEYLTYKLKQIKKEFK